MVQPNFTEDDVKQQMLFITVTLRPDLYGRNARGQFKTSLDKFHSLMRTQLREYVWVAELTDKGNVHYHCVGYDIDTYSKDIILDATKCHKILGNTKINTQRVEDTERTYNYLIKDLERTHAVINRNKDILEVSGKWVKPRACKAKPATKVMLPILKVENEDGAYSDTEEWLWQVSKKK